MYTPMMRSAAVIAVMAGALAPMGVAWATPLVVTGSGERSAGSDRGADGLNALAALATPAPAVPVALARVDAAPVAAAGAAGTAAAPAAPVAPVPPPAAPAPAVVTLVNGDALRGVLISDGDPVVIEHEALGRVSVPRARVKDVAAGPSAAAPGATPPSEMASKQPAPAEAAPSAPAPAAASGTPAPDAQFAAGAPAVAAPASPVPAAPPAAPAGPAVTPEQSFFDGWTGTFEAGANGAGGDENRLSGRVSITLRRAMDGMATTGAFSYHYGQSNGDESQDRAQVEARNEWSVTKDMPVGLYVAGIGEYDEFQAWDWRSSGSAGLTYKLVEDDTLTIALRSGLGASKEFGRVDAGVRAEVTPGLDFRWRINEKQSLTGAVDAWLDLDRIDTYRTATRAAWEILLDPANKLSLKFGVEYRTDIAPMLSRDREVFEYFTLLVLRF